MDVLGHRQRGGTSSLLRSSRFFLPFRVRKALRFSRMSLWLCGGDTSRVPSLQRAANSCSGCLLWLPLACSGCVFGNLGSLWHLRRVSRVRRHSLKPIFLRLLLGLSSRPRPVFVPTENSGKPRPQAAALVAFHRASSFFEPWTRCRRKRTRPTKFVSSAPRTRHHFLCMSGHSAPWRSASDFVLAHHWIT